MPNFTPNNPIVSGSWNNTNPTVSGSYTQKLQKSNITTYGDVLGTYGMISTTYAGYNLPPFGVSVNTAGSFTVRDNTTSGGYIPR